MKGPMLGFTYPKPWILKLVLYDCLETVKLGLELVNHQANSRVTISLYSTQPHLIWPESYNSPNWMICY